MNISIVYSIVTAAGLILPGIVAGLAFCRSRKQGKWQDELWNLHTTETDSDKRAKLRSEMRDLDGLCSESTQVSLRGSVLAVLLGIQSAILWTLAAKGSSSDLKLFWVLVVTAAVAWVLIAVILIRPFRED